MKEQFKLLLENGQFDEAREFIKNTDLLNSDVIDCLIETLKAHRKILIDSIRDMKFGMDYVVPRSEKGQENFSLKKENIAG